MKCVCHLHGFLYGVDGHQCVLPLRCLRAQFAGLEIQCGQLPVIRVIYYPVWKLTKIIRWTKSPGIAKNEAESTHRKDTL